MTRTREQDSNHNLMSSPHRTKMQEIFKRTLGKSGVEVGAPGLGCCAMGGEWMFDGLPVGWGRVDDAESQRAIQRR